MSCVPIPDIPVPELPAGISITPTFPSQDFDESLCCKILNIPLTIPPLPIPPLLLNPAVNKILKSAIKGVQEFIDKLPHDCPKELQRPTS